MVLLGLLGGCQSLGSSGPTFHAVTHASETDPRIRIVDVNEGIVRTMLAAQSQRSFASLFGEARQDRGLIGPGAALDITIWEAPPAVLFPRSDSGLAGSPATTGSVTAMPGQVLAPDGTVSVPFAGRVLAQGRTAGAVAEEIAERLRAKAHDPQVTVRIADNQAGDVIVTGDVVTSQRLPLTNRNERLLDAIATAGGVRQPVDKVLIQITRGNRAATRPLGAIIRDPAENVILCSNDVIIAIAQPYSFQAMGAVGTSAEISFEGTGITLAQALTRAGGLQDARANAKGLFVFRLESPQSLPPELRDPTRLTLDGKIPVIYRIDLANPSSIFALQTFPMRDKDILYVSNAPLSDLQKFVTLVSQITFSIAGIAANIR